MKNNYKDNHTLPPQGVSASWWTTLLLAFFTIGLALNWHGMHAGFVSDDFQLVDTVKRAGPFAAWTYFPAPFFRPLISLSLWLNYKAGGLDPIGYHLTNVIVHIFNSTLVAAISLQLLHALQWNGNRRRVAVVAGVLFLVQQTHPEAVTWIVGRTDLISTFFYLASFSAYLAYREKGGTRRSLALLSLLLFCLSLLSKELAVTLPVLILLYELFLWKGLKRSHLNLSFIAYFAIVILYVVVRRLMLGQWVGGYSSMTVGSWQLLSSFFFLTIAFLPPIISMNWLPVLLTVILAGCLWYRQHKGYPFQPVMAFCLIALLLTFLPVLPLMRGRPLNGINGRLIYVGTTFSCLLTALVGDLLLPSARAFLTAAALLTVLNGVFFVQANDRWWNAGALCRRLLADAGPVLPAQKLYILNIPDSLNGPFVLNNGVFAGLDLKYHHPFKDSHVLSYMSLASTKAPVLLTRFGSDFYLLHTPPNPRHPVYFLGSAFDANNIDQGDGFYAIRSRVDDSVRIHLTGLGPGDRVLYYSAGHFIPLPIQTTGKALLSP